ncbi:hypothetical protein ACHAQA_002731 [Verticillium albo-atrum]
MIIGPHDTPYEFGFFEFAFKFNKEYPRKSPLVTAVTTNSGRCRFNPNIYSTGKVCLSILGTWRGERGEEWSAAQGLESILLSIQSLMSGNPYENEPGFEEANEPADKKNQEAYVQKVGNVELRGIRHETLRISVIQRMEQYLGLTPDGVALVSQSAAELEGLDPDSDDQDESSVPFEPFKDLCKRRFLWYYDSYLEAIHKAQLQVKDHQPFERMPFEGASNSMEGKFNYTELERRLHNIKGALDAELDKWAKEGFEAKNKETTVSVNLQHQFEQITQNFKRRDIPHDIQLEDKNPFIWVITYFGRPMTNLDGGLFRIKIHFSPRFPDEQPRVQFDTKIFHHRIALDGTACYSSNPMRKEDVLSHIEAVFDNLEEEDPAYDPRTLVNLEANKLYWSGADGRKNYNRRLRRSVQQSTE